MPHGGYYILEDGQWRRVFGKGTSVITGFTVGFEDVAPVMPKQAIL